MSATILLGGQVDKLPGSHDDGSNDGILVTKPAYQGLVKLPILQSGYVGGTNGLGTVSTGATMTNPDGSQSHVNLTVPAATSSAASGAYAEAILHGPRIGVRFKRTNAITVPAFTVVVDGVPYAVRNISTRRHASALINVADFEGLFMIADDLGDGPHTVRVIVAGDPPGGVSKALLLYGWLVDAVKGYPRGLNRASLIASAPTALTTSAVAIAATNQWGLVRKLYFHNTDATQRIVTVSIGTTNIIRTLTLAAGTSGELDFGEPIQVQQVGIYWKADAGAVVNAWAAEVS